MLFILLPFLSLALDLRIPTKHPFSFCEPSPSRETTHPFLSVLGPTVVMACRLNLESSNRVRP
jgi:hypothetical protein